MHFAVKFIRMHAEGEPISTLLSFYVLTKDPANDERWGGWVVQARSSFAGVSNSSGSYQSQGGLSHD